MNELLNLLKDGHARTTLMLASELHTTQADIRRKLEFLENAGIIKRISFRGRRILLINQQGRRPLFVSKSRFFSGFSVF